MTDRTEENQEKANYEFEASPFTQQEADIHFKNITVEGIKEDSKNLNRLIKKGGFVERTKLRNLKIVEPLKIMIRFRTSKICNVQFAFSGRVNITATLFYELPKNFITKNVKKTLVKKLFSFKKIGDEKNQKTETKKIEGEIEETSRSWMNIHQEIITKKSIRPLSRKNLEDQGNLIILKIEKYEEESNPLYSEIEEGGLEDKPKVDLDMPVLSYFKIFCNVSDQKISNLSEKKKQKKKLSSFRPFKKIKGAKKIDDVKIVFEKRKKEEIKPMEKISRFDQLMARKRMKKPESKDSGQKKKKLVKLTSKIKLDNQNEALVAKKKAEISSKE